MRGLEVYAVNTPSREVGGDFYDFLPYTDGCAAFAVGEPHSEGRAVHALQHHGRALQDAHGGVAAFESVRGVVDEPWLKLVGDPAPRNPPEQGLELAADRR